MAHEVEGLVKREQLPELDEVRKYRSRIQRAWDQHQRDMLSSRQRPPSLEASSLMLEVKDRVDGQSEALASSHDPIECDNTQDAVPVWMAEDEHGAAGWLELRLQRTPPTVSGEQIGAVDQEEQTGHMNKQQMTEPASLLNDKHAQKFVGMSNLQRDVAKTLRLLLTGRALKASNDATGSGAVNMLELIDAPSDHNPQVVVQEEVTEQITAYSMDMMVMGSSLVIEVLSPFRFSCLSVLADIWPAAYTHS